MAYKQIRRRMKQEIAENDGAAPEVHHAPDLSQIQTDRDLMTADDAMALQDLVGNRAVTQLTGATKSTTPARAGYVQPKPLPAPMLRRESLPDRPAYAHIMRKLTSLSSQGGERTIQRAGGDGSFETNDSFESKVKQQSGGGQPLPSDVRADLEPKFGADFSGVKIHTGSTAAQLSQDVGAQAFTHGSDIYFNQGKYNPESGSGKHLLAHELTHTVQQGAAGVQRVQRLMSLQVFQAATPGAFRSRSGIAPIDTLLTQYNALNDQPENINARKDKLAELKTACANYTGNRKAGVQHLHQEVQNEQLYIDRLALAVTQTNTGTRNSLKLAFQGIFAAQDTYLRLVREGHPLDMAPDFDRLITNGQIKLGDIGERGSVMQELIADDLTTLTTIGNNPQTPQLLRNIIAEALANRNKTHFQETGGVASGAVLAGEKDRNKGINTKYRLDMQMNQSGGSAVRISSLLHEMTHIATQEAFQNTPIHLAFNRNATDQQILDLSTRRTGQITQLETALNTTKAYWSQPQYAVLMEKTKYPVEGRHTLASYANTFLNNDTWRAEHTRMLDLQARGANNTLVEFDTVINQMLYMMQAWNVPNDNAFYTTLSTIAEEAYNLRQAGLVNPPQVNANPPQVDANPPQMGPENLNLSDEQRAEIELRANSARNKRQGRRHG